MVLASRWRHRYLVGVETSGEGFVSISPEVNAWRIGDRVLVAPSGERKHGPGWVSGTITAIDEAGVPLGVRVQLDWTVNGVDYCYATHGELRRVR